VANKDFVQLINVSYKAKNKANTGRNEPSFSLHYAGTSQEKSDADKALRHRPAFIASNSYSKHQRCASVA
jgi:hypothetical protein